MFTVSMPDEHIQALINHLKRDRINATGLYRIVLDVLIDDLMKGEYDNEQSTYEKNHN